MKDEMDILLEKTFPSNMEPSKEINAKILDQAAQKRKKGIVLGLPKVAAVIIAIACISPVGVYAATYIINNVLVTEHAISVGNPDYVDDDAIAASEEEAVTEDVLYKEGDETVNWISKEVQKVNNYATNTYYKYADYETALLDSGLDNWFNKSYKNDSHVTYVVSEMEDVLERSIDATFIYGGGSFSIYEAIMTGNIADDMAHSIMLQNTNNIRTYTSVSGQEFTLVDQITNDGIEEYTTTFVMVSYDKYYGYISFNYMTDDEIHEVLDTFEVR